MYRRQKLSEKIDNILTRISRVKNLGDEVNVLAELQTLKGQVALLEAKQAEANTLLASAGISVYSSESVSQPGDVPDLSNMPHNTCPSSRYAQDMAMMIINEIDEDLLNNEKETLAYAIINLCNSLFATRSQLQDLGFEWRINERDETVWVSQDTVAREQIDAGAPEATAPLGVKDWLNTPVGFSTVWENLIKDLQIPPVHHPKADHWLAVAHRSGFVSGFISARNGQSRPFEGSLQTRNTVTHWTNNLEVALAQRTHDALFPTDQVSSSEAPGLVSTLPD